MKHHRSRLMILDDWDDLEPEKQFRTTICHRKDVPCKHYQRCSDREYNATPELRKWEHEIHGNNCWSEPVQRLRCWGGSILGSVKRVVGLANTDFGGDACE